MLISLKILLIFNLMTYQVIDRDIIAKTHKFNLAGQEKNGEKK